MIYNFLNPLFGWLMLSKHEEQCDNMIATGKFENIEWRRAGGDCVCQVCGRKYYDHPQHVPHYYLRMLCNGDLVKL